MSGESERPGAVITPYRDGPYLIRGSFSVCDQDGNPIPLARRTIALCRCGNSRTRPFCDGTHRVSGFRAPSGRDVDVAGEAGQDGASTP